MKRNAAAVPGAPSVTRGESMDSVGASSSSVTVPVPAPAPGAMEAFTGALNVTATVSSGSSATSPMTVTSIVRLVSPAAKVSVPAASAV